MAKNIERLLLLLIFFQLKISNCDISAAKHVNETFSNLNETFDRMLERDLKDTSKKLQKLDDQIKQIVMNSSSSTAVIGWIETIAVWVFLAFVTMIMAVIGFVMLNLLLQAFCSVFGRCTQLNRICLVENDFKILK